MKRTSVLRWTAFAGSLAVAGLLGVNAGSAQTQYPISPPVVLTTPSPTVPAPGAAVKIDPQAPAAVPAVVPATAAPVAPTTIAAVAPAAVAEKLPTAEVLGETIRKTATPAFTGSATAKPLAAAGAALVLAGAFFVVATRRRRSKA